MTITDPMAQNGALALMSRLIGQYTSSKPLSFGDWSLARRLNSSPPRRSIEVSSPEFFRVIDFYPTIDKNRCVRCMACISHCSLGVIKTTLDTKMENVSFIISRHVCRNCRSCVEACPAKAISIKLLK